MRYTLSGILAHVEVSHHIVWLHRTAALCGLVGQALGKLAGDTLFLMLESAGILTLSGQLSFNYDTINIVIFIIIIINY